MTKPRKAITLATSEIETQQEAIETIGQIADDMLAERDLKNALDAELQSVRAKYESDLLDAAKRIETGTDLVASYFTQHPDLFPKDVKSLDVGRAVIGFRTGTPKVKMLKRWTIKAVLDAVKARRWFDLIRTSYELDKEAVLAQREKLGPALATVGLAVVQDETFFIEPKLSDMESRIATARSAGPKGASRGSASGQLQDQPSAVKVEAA